ncbi:MAG: hypothetical protein M1828_007302 [Chrysothrix sp. TS-e1954]|nr:MAG: hypothetical protein M1828_007302 [Chrysothrix sp. TS-e1954]
MSTHTALEAASLDRKARLAQLKSLKRKQPDSTPSDDTSPSAGPNPPKRPSRSPSPLAPNPHLSGRNYDATTRAPKLGYDTLPNASASTLESQAQALSDRTRAQADQEAKEDKPLDLFKIQPKRPNWDLKRDLKKRLEESGLERELDRAIARAVRERVGKAAEMQKSASEDSGCPRKNENGRREGGGEVIGMEGPELVEATRELEREEAEAKRRDEEDDETS